MQHLNLNQPGLPDLQYVLLISALCTSELESFNVPASVRATVFNRCWALVNEGPVPTEQDKRTLNLRLGDELMLEALVNVIRQTFEEHGFSELTWEQQASEPTRASTPDVLPLIERIQKLYPPPDDVEPSSSSPSPS